MCVDSVVMCGHMKMLNSGTVCFFIMVQRKTKPNNDFNNVHVYIVHLFPEYSNKNTLRL